MVRLSVALLDGITPLDAVYGKLVVGELPDEREVSLVGSRLLDVWTGVLIDSVVEPTVVPVLGT